MRLILMITMLTMAVAQQGFTNDCHGPKCLATQKASKSVGPKCGAKLVLNVAEGGCHGPKC